MMDSLKNLVNQTNWRKNAMYSNMYNRIENTSEYSIKNAAIFAEMSEDCYLDPKTFKGIWSQHYVIEFIEGEDKGAEAYTLTDRDNLIIVFRGTEPSEWSDIKADCRFFKTDAEYAGRVHRGFKGYLDRIWEPVVDSFNSNSHRVDSFDSISDRRVWVIGHSLGAAMATLTGSRLAEVSKDIDIVVYNYGSPRVGNSDYRDAFKIPLYRHRNNNDVVTRNPIETIGYTHVGELKYFDSEGVLKEGYSRWHMFGQWCSGTVDGIFSWPPSLDGFSDHSMSNYVRVCENSYAGKIHLNEE